MPAPRFQPPDRLVGATAFSQDDALRGSLNVVQLLKGNRWLWRPLRDACKLGKSTRDGGSRRDLGNWELAAVAFVVSDYIDIQPWHDDTTPDLWRACGFQSKPSYRTCWRRLRELETVADTFLDAVGVLVRRARAQDPRVLAHVHFDNTEDETHAALIHDCDRGNCPQRKKGHAAGRGRAGAGDRPARQDTTVMREDRHRLAAMAPEDAERELDAHGPTNAEIVRRGSRVIKRVLIGGCWYRTLDVDAGIRAYMGPRGARRFWHGYYSGKAVDHSTGGVIPLVVSASRQEYDLFEDHYDLVCRLLGAAPETAVADKGLSVASAFQKCTSNGTAPIFPWRPHGGDFKRHDQDTHDRHGVPRCKHCGSPTDFVRFDPGDQNKPEDRRNPRMWVLCMSGATEKCAKVQTISCKGDYRLLVPLWRTEPLYHELKESHGTYEAAHDWWRDRYKVAADDIGVRPKVRSLDWHRLRANVAALVDWLRICYRQGWLGSPKRNHRTPERKFKERGAVISAKLANLRARVGVMTAYGEQAVKVFPGAMRVPPSRRPRGAPPGQTMLDIPV